MKINQVKENIWEIPPQGGMNAPARMFASEKLLEKIKQDKTLEQVRNIAHLPGIQKYSIALPDAHQGYGFPIGGVAALDAEQGAISPGGIGYDINCLSGDSQVLLEFGRHRTIKQLRGDFARESATVAGDKTRQSPIQLFTEKEQRDIFAIETETGERLKASRDHPFLTEDGMKKLENLSKGETVYIRPFKGLPDEEPEGMTVLSEENWADEDPQLIKALKKRGLLTLTTKDRKFNLLLKLVGFHTGDGSFNKNGQSDFYGKKEDLQNIRADIEELGFKPSRIYSRHRSHQYKDKTFERTEYKVKSNSRTLKKLLIKLGAPAGKKTAHKFRVPSYLHQLTGWQKALYLSAFFGAEMSSPKAEHDKDFYCPKISQNKSYQVKEWGEKFLQDIKQLLTSLDIETNKIESFEAKENKDGRVMRFRLGIKNDLDNLIKFFARIGYQYHLEKQKKSIKALMYLKTKKKAIEKRERIAKKCLSLYNEGVEPKGIKSRFEINDRFIERSIYSGRKTRARPPADFPKFAAYSQELEVNDNLTVKVPIKTIKKVGKGPVYDLGVEAEAHNFIANSFVVSNCGVRLLRSDLNYEDVKKKRKQLLNILFQKIPLGLGKGQTVDVSRSDLERIMRQGMQWAQEEGYATKKDLKHAEENGSLAGDPEYVSDKAINRGLNQVGSLGSGNHFVEVQRVEEIYDQSTARDFGLRQDQITVTIHTGSRGFGHQICSDYLRKMEKEYKDLIKDLPDKELVYAPAQDKLAREYFKAMQAAANFAWNNRQLISHNVRECFSTILKQEWEDLGLDLVYDVAHNIAKREEHEIGGSKKEVYVHRKGATRSFPPGRKEIPRAYRKTGQPVIIPGSMGTATYVLRGTETAMDLTFGSTAHGAGRLMSRKGAKREFWGETVQKELKRDNILVKSQSGGSGIAEEAPGAYKDIDEVVRVSDALGIGQKVAKLVPVVNVKG